MGGAPAFKRTLAKPLVDIALFTFFSLELVRAIRQWFAHRPSASPVEGVVVAPLIHALDASQALLLERLVSVALEELSSDDERHHRSLQSCGLPSGVQGHRPDNRCQPCA